MSLVLCIASLVVDGAACIVTGCRWCCAQALEALNKKDLTEIKSYGKPPALVEKVMEAVMILRGFEPTWAEAKKQLGALSSLVPGPGSA